MSPSWLRSVLNEIKQREQLAVAYKELDKNRQRLFDLATEQKDIIDVMGHEIRTPLTAIIQELNLQKVLMIPKKQDWLDNKINEEDRIKMLNLVFESFDTIDKSSAQAVQLVTDMLETARLDKQRFELDYSTFEIAHEIEASTQIMSKTVEEGVCEIELINKLPAGFIIEADKTRVRESVDALINNAIKYRDQHKKKCLIKVELSKVGSNIQIDIIDNGIGIAKSDIAKLGKKFVRLNPKTNDTIKRPGGTGLGLFVVKGIMDYHKGKFVITSDGVGKGSKFTLIIPIKKP